ncbi:MAG: UbiX family flavin prenyltransferase [Clostridiales bacterium]|nr:UbiX family flavin prenyltransferase [Clostridiales bacterium]
MVEKRLIIGISGASGAPIAVALLKALQSMPVQTHLVVTKGGEMTLSQECGMNLEDASKLADVTYDNSNIGAALASGTFTACGMVVAPASMKTVAGIHSGYSDNLLLRAADVVLKEGRKLILVPRESPLSQIHLRNLLDLSQMGVRILPPMLSYYSSPQTIEDMTNHMVGKILDQLGYAPETFIRWEGMK